MNRPAAAVAAMVAATALWGATFVLLRDVLEAIAPVDLVCARFTAAAVVFGVLLVARGRRPDRAALTGGALAGVFGAGGFLLQAIGLETASAGSSAFLTAAGTLSAGLFAWLLFGERPGPALAAGLVLGAAGSALVSLHGALRIGTGEAWTLAGSLAFALQVVAIARFAPRAEPVALTGVQVATMALVTAPFATAAPARLAALGAADLWRIAYLVVAASVAAPLLQVFAQRTIPAGRIGLLFALEPVFGVLFAVSVGMERFTARWWAGAALILVAVLTVEGRAARRASDPAPSR